MNLRVLIFVLDLSASRLDVLIGLGKIFDLIGEAPRLQSKIANRLCGRIEMLMKPIRGVAQKDYSDANRFGCAASLPPKEKNNLRPKVSRCARPVRAGALSDKYRMDTALGGRSSYCKLSGAGFPWLPDPSNFDP